MRDNVVVLADVGLVLELETEDDVSEMPEGDTLKAEHDGHKKPGSEGRGRDGAVTVITLREIAMLGPVKDGGGSFIMLGMNYSVRAGRNVSSVCLPAVRSLSGKFGIAPPSPSCAGNATSSGGGDDFLSPISTMFGSIGDTTLAPGDAAERLPLYAMYSSSETGLIESSSEMIGD
jgi:hypothetical protein